MKFNSLVLSGIMCAMLSIPAVYAQEQSGHERMHKGHEVFKQLNLTDDQKTQLEANKKQRRDQMKTWAEQMKAQREAMRQELMKKDLDMGKVNAIQSQIKTLEAQMTDNRLNSILEVRKILTPEQFNKFISMMEQNRSKMHGFEGRRHFKNKNSDEDSK
jgi:Spy/CpxP family protein refolding chaperone